VEQARALYAEGVAAGERALGPAAFAEHAGAFWDVLRTRPYMRARFGLAQSLEGLGRLDEAIGHYQELLRLNPNDNQGARYVLLSALLRTGRDGEAGALLGQFEDDPAAIWRYGRALFAFRRDGDAPAARERLRQALRANRRVAKYLEGRAEVPDELPALYGLGSEEEAMICAYELEGAWRATPGAGAWLAAAARPSRKRGRR
jgi:tetratricopeptide (TPR) repeat protein